MNRYTREDCIEALKEAREELGHPPTHHEYAGLDLYPCSGTIKTILGSWNKAKEVAGMEVNRDTSSVDADYGYFESMDSQVAYWLGFIYGDGSVYADGDSMKFVLALQESDASHLKKFHEAIGSNHTISECDGKCWLQIKNSRFVDSLQRLGVDEKKTFSSSLPELEQVYQCDFVRGLFDADGYIGDYEWCITGSNEVRFSRLGRWLPVDSRVYDYPNEPKYQLKVSTKSDLEQLAKWLYPNGTNTKPKLERKNFAGYAECGARLEGDG